MDLEIFTLVVWLAHGERLEEVRVPNLGNLECVERLLAIEGRQGRGYCIDDGGGVFPNDRGAPMCGQGRSCGRSEVTSSLRWPVVCPFAGPCWQAGTDGVMRPLPGALDAARR
jgi:hypothetical protein